MFAKISIGVLVVLGLFLSYVATRDGKFHYERSGLIQAPKEKIYPYISQFKLCSEWSPYEKNAPNMKKEFTGVDGEVGSKMVFESQESGSGSLEFLNLVPNESAELRLLMTAPFAADHHIKYKLTTEGDATRFTWSMSGDGGFMGKLIGVLIDCEKMVGNQFLEGIQNLKVLMEAQK